MVVLGDDVSAQWRNLGDDATLPILLCAISCRLKQFFLLVVGMGLSTCPPV
jgi:hypothetical protein